jgi:hypothetical protein
MPNRDFKFSQPDKLSIGYQLSVNSNQVMKKVNEMQFYTVIYIIDEFYFLPLTVHRLLITLLKRFSMRKYYLIPIKLIK